MENSEKIGGPGKIVEIDESKFGKRKYNKGKRVEGEWVFGGVERESSASFMVIVPDRSADTLLRIIKKNIVEGTTIYSDCWRSYNCLETEGFKHLTVNHSYYFKDPDSGVHTNKIEGAWKWAKASLPESSRYKEHLPGYLHMHLWTKEVPRLERFQ